MAFAGILDPSFGKAGVAAVQFGPTGSVVESAAIQTDAKTVVVGYEVQEGPGFSTIETFAVARFKADGSPDTSFGTDGVATPFAAQSATEDTAGVSVAIQPNGDIVVLGSVGGQIAVARLTPSGQLDTRFGRGGSVLFSFGSSPLSQSPTQVAIDPSGKIVIAGTVYPTTNTVRAGVARLDADGSFDGSFGQGGQVVFAFNPIGGANPVLATGGASALAIQADGKVDVTASSSGTIEVARLDGDGSLDASFGTSGQVTVPLDAGGSMLHLATADAISIQSGGDILLAGTAFVYAGPPSSPTSVTLPQPFVARLLPSGAADDSFNGTGLALSGSPSLSTVSVSGVTTLRDGTILVFGNDLNQMQTTNLVRFNRLNADGSTDTTFGTDGEILSTASGLLTSLLATLPDGKIEAANSSELLRFLDNAVAGDFTGDGIADPAVYLPAYGAFAIRPSTGGPDHITLFGIPGPGNTIPAPGDYSGSGSEEIAAYLPTYGIYAYRPNGGGPDVLTPFGIPGSGNTIPAPGDYEGTGKDDIAVYLPTLGEFGIRPATGGPDELIPFGIKGPGQSIPVPGDYDGSGKTELAVYLPGLGAYAYRPANGGPDVIMPFGIPGVGNTIPMPGDYDGSGHTELGVYLPTLGEFIYRPAGGGPDVVQAFGIEGVSQTLPMPGDYTGSGHTELGVYLPSLGEVAFRPAGGGPDVLFRFGVAGSGQTVPVSAVVLSPFPGTVSAAAVSAESVSAESVDGGLLDFLPAEAAGKKARPGGPAIGQDLAATGAPGSMD